MSTHGSYLNFPLLQGWLCHFSKPRELPYMCTGLVVLEACAQSDEFTDHKQYFLETCPQRGRLGADHHQQHF